MRPLHVGLLWHAFGHPNLGVDALARANAALIGEAAASLGLRPTFVTLGSAASGNAPMPADVTAGPHPSIRELALGRSRFLEAIRRCDIVFDIGEGDSFTDLYGARRFAYQAATKFAVLAAGVPLVLSPQTIGPFTAPHHRAIAASLLRRSRAVHVRDGLSRDYAASLGVASPAEFTDTAFALPYRQAERGRRPRVAVNVSGLLWNRSVATRLDYRAFTCAVLDAFTATSDADLYLFAHVNGASGADTDVPLLGELSRRYPQARIAPLFATSQDAKSFLSGVDFVVTARMHAAIAAFSSGVPVVPVAYSRKVNGLFASLGYDCYVDAQSDDLASAVGRTLEAYRHRDERAGQVAAGRAVAARRLDAYRSELTRLLAVLPVAQRRSRPHEPA